MENRFVMGLVINNLAFHLFFKQFNVSIKLTFAKRKSKINIFSASNSNYIIDKLNIENPNNQQVSEV